MKLKNATKVILTVVALIGLTLTAATAKAVHYPYSGMAKEDCVVSSPYWGATRDRRLSLAVANALTTLPDSRQRLCQKAIYIDVDEEIMMREPLVIRHHGNATYTAEENDAGEVEHKINNDYFIVQGGTDGAPREIVLNAGEIVDWGEHECAVVLEGGAVRLSNIKVQNVPDGKNGVCIKGSNSILEKVFINEAFGGDAFVIDEGSVGNWILPGSGASGIKAGHKFIKIKSDIALEGSGVSLLGNHFIPTNEVPSETDENGFAANGGARTTAQIMKGSLETTDGLSVIRSTVQVNDANFIDASGDASVQIRDIVLEEDGFVAIEGAIVSSAPSVCEVANGMKLVRNVVRLQVYKVSTSQITFYGYVTERGDGDNFGMDKDGVNANGEFEFRVNASGGDRIIIIPELNGGFIGSSSRVIDLADYAEQADCTSTTTTGGGLGLGFYNVADCRDQRNLSHRTVGQRAKGYDTDGDNIEDDDEDINRNCRCDKDPYFWDTENNAEVEGLTTGENIIRVVETCWWNPDTDSDGIRDGAETDKVDHDGDGLISNVDKDSDNDGLLDGEEDRNYFHPTTDHTGTIKREPRLYRYESGFMLPIAKQDGSGYVECSLSTNDSIGVRYSWYTVSPGKDPKSYNGEAWSPDAELEEEENKPSIKIFICRNQTLGAPTNFDGSYDPRTGETDPAKPDTDGDGWCDGNGMPNKGTSGCEGLAHDKVMDACPTIPNEADQNSCKMQIPCVDNQVFYTTASQYIEWEKALRCRRCRD